MRPLRRAVADGLDLDRRLQRHVVVVAADHQGALFRQGHHPLHDGHRVCAVADKIAQQGQLLRPLFLGVRQTGVQRLQIGMDIGQQSKLHGFAKLLQASSCTHKLAVSLHRMRSFIVDADQFTPSSAQGRDPHESFTPMEESDHATRPRRLTGLVPVQTMCCDTSAPCMTRCAVCMPTSSRDHRCSRHSPFAMSPPDLQQLREKEHA